MICVWVLLNQTKLNKTKQRNSHLIISFRHTVYLQRQLSGFADVPSVMFYFTRRWSSKISSQTTVSTWRFSHAPSSVSLIV